MEIVIIVALTTNFKIGGKASGPKQIRFTGYIERHKVEFLFKQSGH
jgi:hypothetical protein